ncbi:MAG: FtsQ-type POTRA domain-containing protein [Deltaproteobacteria bacterium]
MIYGSRQASPRRPGSGRRRLRVFLIIRRVALAILVCLFVAAGAYMAPMLGHWVENLTVFRLTNIHISGNFRVPQDEILAASGLSAGMSTLSIDLSSVAKGVEGHPWIETCTVKRILPDRVEISVKERKPVAVIGTDKLVDRTGRILTSPDPAPDDLPRLTNVSPDEIQNGCLSERWRSALDFISLAASGSKTSGLSSIRSISLEESGGLVVYAGGVDIALLFSPKTDLKEQLKRAERILYQLYVSGNYSRVDSIDLDMGGSRALVRMKD